MVQDLEFLIQNPTDHAVCLYTGEVLAHAKPVCTAQHDSFTLEDDLCMLNSISDDVDSEEDSEVGEWQVDIKSAGQITNGLPDHLSNLVNGDLSSNQVERLIILLTEYTDVFVGQDRKLGRT